GLAVLDPLAKLFRSVGNLSCHKEPLRKSIGPDLLPGELQAAKALQFLLQGGVLGLACEAPLKLFDRRAVFAALAQRLGENSAAREVVGGRSYRLFGAVDELRRIV